MLLCYLRVLLPYKYNQYQGNSYNKFSEGVLWNEMRADDYQMREWNRILYAARKWNNTVFTKYKGDTDEVKETWTENKNVPMPGSEGYKEEDQLVNKGPQIGINQVFDQRTDYKNRLKDLSDWEPETADDWKQKVRSRTLQRRQQFTFNLDIEPNDAYIGSSPQGYEFDKQYGFSLTLNEGGYWQETNFPHQSSSTSEQFNVHVVKHSNPFPGEQGDLIQILEALEASGFKDTALVKQFQQR